MFPHALLCERLQAHGPSTAASSACHILSYSPVLQSLPGAAAVTCKLLFLVFHCIWPPIFSLWESMSILAKVPPLWLIFILRTERKGLGLKQKEGREAWAPSLHLVSLLPVKLWHNMTLYGEQHTSSKVMATARTRVLPTSAGKRKYLEENTSSLSLDAY